MSRIDPRTGALAAAIPVGHYPLFLAVCEDGVGVSSGSVCATRETQRARDGSLVRILRPGSHK